jgi:hypothetical protein
MKDKQKMCTIPKLVLLFVALTTFSTGSLYADQDSKYLDDCVLWMA